jgi:tRNA G18 (ribose-2'-O)-methylase SpoU
VVKLHHYHREKFTSFPADKQKKAILELLCALENNLTNAEYRQQILLAIQDCIDWSVADVSALFKPVSKVNPDASAHALIQIVVPLLRSLKHNYDETDNVIHRFDGINPGNCGKVPFPLTVVLDNLRSAYNVGSIFRTAECVQASKMCLCGITPAPNHPKLSKTAMGTESRLAWQHFAKTEDAIRELKQNGLPIIALETTSQARSIYDYVPLQPVAVIMGCEALGIEDKVLSLADEVLYIPVYGWKNSLNVSNAFALAAYTLSGVTNSL